MPPGEVCLSVVPHWEEMAALQPVLSDELPAADLEHLGCFRVPLFVGTERRSTRTYFGFSLSLKILRSFSIFGVMTREQYPSPGFCL